MNTQPVSTSPLTAHAQSSVQNKGVTLQLIGSKIQQATPKQLRQWLRRFDKTYGTVYAQEALLLNDELSAMCMASTHLTFGFLQASEFMTALRTTVGHDGPPNDSNAARVMFGLDAKTLDDVKGAIRAGYRLFDTAQAYQNLDCLDRAIKDSGLPRASFVVIYKFDALDTRQAALAHLTEAVKPFGYFDGVIIHNANESQQHIIETWQGLKSFKGSHGCKAIGIGNFKVEQKPLLQQLLIINAIDIVQLEAFELIVCRDMSRLLTDLGRPKVLYYQLIQMMQSANISLSRDKISAIANLICESTEGICTTVEPTPVLSSGSQSNRVSNLTVLDPESDDDDSCLGAMNDYILAGRNCTENDAEIMLTSGQSTALEQFIARNEQYREQWKGLSIETQIGQILPDLTPLLHTLRVPRRIDLKKIYVGRDLMTIIRTVLGNSSCDRKWAVELAQLLLMTREQWLQNKAYLSNIT